MAFRSLAVRPMRPSGLPSVGGARLQAASRAALPQRTVWVAQQPKKPQLLQPRRGFALGWDHQAWMREDAAQQTFVPMSKKSQDVLNPQGLKLAAPMPPREPIVTYEAGTRRRNNYECRWLRHNGRLPGSLHFANDPKDERMYLFHIDINRWRTECDNVIGLWNRVFQLQLPDREEPILVIPQNVDMHRVTGQPQHLQVREYVPGAAVRLRLPVLPVNAGISPGLRTGGWLQVVCRQLECTWIGDEYVPTHIKVDLSDVRIRGRKRLYDIVLPHGLVPTHPERNVTLAVIRGRAKGEEDDDEDEAPGGRKK